VVWFAHVRSFIARHRATYWVVVAGLALTVAGVLVSQSRQVEHARAAWGTSVDVWVAAADTAPGAVLEVQRRSVPVAMVPDDAITGVWRVGAVARQSLTSGEIVVAHDLGAGRVPLLAADRRAVAVPTDDGTIAVTIGDHVDVVAVGVVLAADGLVVAVGVAAVTVAVPAEAAPAVAAAALDRTAVIILRSG
jgi:hypothetical protein